VLERLCGRLRIDFDPDFAEKWNNYRWITTAVRERDGGFAISRRPRRETAPELIEAFAGNADYRAAIELLGYGHPE